jgi:hypothetical protein
MDHVRSEIAGLQEKLGFSVTWATEEGGHLIYPLLSAGAAIDPTVLRREIERLPLVIVENAGVRSVVSIEQASAMEQLWTVDSLLFESAELMMREAKGSTSLVRILNALGSTEQLPASFVARPSVTTEGLIFGAREPVVIKCDYSQRRVDFCWGEISRPARWVTIESSGDGVFRKRLSMLRRRFPSRNLTMTVATGGVRVEGLHGEAAVLTRRTFWLVPGTRIASHLVALYHEVMASRDTRAEETLLAVWSVVEEHLGFHAYGRQLAGSVLEERFRRMIEETGVLRRGEAIDVAALLAAVGETNWAVFNPRAWTRRSDELDVYSVG